MNSTVELDHLNLDEASRKEVDAIIARLLNQQTVQHQAELENKDLKIQVLTLEIARLKNLRYGQKTEALSGIQRDLFNDDLDADLAALEAELQKHNTPEPKITVSKVKRNHPGRQTLPAHLPRIVVLHEPASCQCGGCGKDLVKIGEDVTEKLDIIPAQFQVQVDIYPRYACKTCEIIVTEPVAATIINGGLATIALLVWLVIGKYLDHLPLYRLQQIAAREKVEIARSTLSGWIGVIGFELSPLWERLIWHLKQGNVCHADETPVAQLNPGSGKTKRAYLWAYRSNDLQKRDRIIVFDYQQGRSGHYACEFLKDWTGHLMVDDYAGYKVLFKSGQCIELTCWIHARRKFIDLYKADNNTIAREALDRIARLYAVEDQAKELSIEERATLRAEKSIPELQALYDWLLKVRSITANGGGTAKAIDYTLRRWQSLERYAQTGHLPIDNNPVENGIRPIALGRKNWLFVGSKLAGERAAVIQSLLATAKLNGHDPAAWLKNTLEKLPVWPNSRIDELLPLASWKPLP